MRPTGKQTHYFHAHANSLGGFVDKPFQKHMPPQASNSLPSVGGHATSRTEAFNFEEVISCRCAYTRVSGSKVDETNGATVLITSVVEGLNILEVVTADRVVAQVSIDATPGKPHEVSFAGSRFEGLLIAGHDPGVTMNPGLLGLGRKPGAPPVTWPLFHETGRQQAGKLVAGIKGKDLQSYKWLADRYSWMDSNAGKGELALCSLVDGYQHEIPARSFGHVIDIPDFGRLFLGELLVSSSHIEISMIRAELGCGTSGGGTAGGGHVGVQPIPP